MQNLGMVANQYVVFERAPLEMNPVTEHTVVTHHRRPHRRRVQDGCVLYRCAGANLDVPAITSQDGARPD